MEQASISLKIGQVVITATRGEFCPPLSILPSHQPFLVENSQAAISLRVRYGHIPEPCWSEKIFDSNGPWAIYRHQGTFWVPFFSPVISSSHPCRVLRCNETFSDGELFVRPYESFEGSLPAGVVYPFEYPLDELLLLNYFAKNRLGVIAHALGIIEDGRGILFCGVSGAGKSTLAEIWRKTDVIRLSDDRTIVAPQDNRVMIYGTPWHGDAQIASTESAPLEKLYFISHASENRVSRLTQAQAASRLLVRCFPPFYDQSGMDNVLEMVSRIVARIPCYDLGFVADENIVDFIRNHHATF